MAREKRSRKQTITITLGVLILVTGGLAIWSVFKQPGESSTAREPHKTDLGHLMPGQQKEITVGREPVQISIPQGEGASIGTFRLASPNQKYASDVLDRDGLLETAFVGDFTGDHQEDVLIVIRNAGSASSAQLYLFEANAQGFHASQLPEPPTNLIEGYQGHDAISIVAGRIAREFPLYIDNAKLRIDKSYTTASAMKRESPILTKPDTNVHPSGGTRRILYNISRNTWE